VPFLARVSLVPSRAPSWGCFSFDGSSVGDAGAFDGEAPRRGGHSFLVMPGLVGGSVCTGVGDDGSQHVRYGRLDGGSWKSKPTSPCQSGRLVVVTAAPLYKCPAAPYKARC